MRRTRLWTLTTAAALILAPLAASAREESKIRLFMESANGGNTERVSDGSARGMARAGGGSARGMLRSQLAPGSAELRVHVNGLAPDHEHLLLGDGVEVARFTTNASGSAEVRIDLLATGGGTTPTFDPRGKLLAVNDGAVNVLEAWVYADPSQDPPRPRIKEVTSLARDAATQGTVDASYDALPSGGARFAIALRGVAAGDYDVIVGGTTVATVTPNPSGVAMVDLRVGPGGGNGAANGNGNGNAPPHKHRGALTANPRSQWIELEMGGVVQFAGEMRAQIPGLGTCAASAPSASLSADPAQTSGTGSVTFGVEAGCDRHMTLTLTDVAVGDYDLLIAGADVGDVAVTGTGTGSAVLDFDDVPDAMLGELPMPAGAASGASIAIQEKMPLGTDVIMTGTLP